MILRNGLAAAACLGLMLGTAVAAPPDAAQIATAGNGHGAPACASCHGTNGGGQATSGYPRLAGLDAAYIKRQLESFTNGTRNNPIMGPIAQSLDASERQKLAAYYANIAPPSMPAPMPPNPAERALGARLATRGLWDKQVPGCVQCHGPGGVGVGAHFPPLAGQSALYLANQLRDWRQGNRRNDPLGLMQHVASALTDADIAAVSAWFAAQPVAPAGGQP